LKFAEKFSKRRERILSPLCVGLDPEFEKLPSIVKNQLSPLSYFCKAIVDATADYACAYKPNIAFFERFGSKGIAQFEEVIGYIQSKYPSIPIVVDCKRGDLANTSKEYARYYFQTLGVDSITVSPYMGMDSLLPYLDEGGHIFVLCLTSNKGSSDFQRLPLEFSTPFFEHLALFFEGESSKYEGQIGIVVGATHPFDLERVRNLATSLHLLVPGYGAQGGKLEDILPICGNQALINSSRSILFASSGEDFAEKARLATSTIQAEIYRVLGIN
jgi:orotidine-5'-phosphate decarboxylase